MQASKLADGLRNTPAAVLSGLTAKFGAVTVSGLRTVEQACMFCSAPCACRHVCAPACMLPLATKVLPGSTA